MKLRPWALLLVLLLSLGCSVLRGTYTLTKGTVKGTLWVVKTTYKAGKLGAEVVYKVGGFTFKVVKAPLSWPLMRGEIESIDGLPPKEAIRLGRVKNSPYRVRGRTYWPMSIAEANRYREVGVASWYGYETRLRPGGHMTANGEAFDPEGLSAAHRRLPLPWYVRVTNLENGRSIIVRVNDRGPFAQEGERIIDLSAGAAKRLGFFKKGTARVLVESLPVKMARD
jgi:rare lipoprotein A